MKNPFRLLFYTTGEAICGADFQDMQKVTISKDFILSLSDIKEFNMPFSGKHVGRYAILTMCNNDKYCITEGSFNTLDAMIL